MALEVVFEKFKIYHILRYNIYEFLKKFRVVLDRPVWAPVGKDPLCSGAGLLYVGVLLKHLCS